MIQNIQNTRANTNFGAARLASYSATTQRLTHLRGISTKLTAPEEHSALTGLLKRLLKGEFNAAKRVEDSNKNTLGYELQSKKSGDRCSFSFSQSLNDTIDVDTNQGEALNITKDDKMPRVNRDMFNEVMFAMKELVVKAETKAKKAVEKAAAQAEQKA